MQEHEMDNVTLDADLKGLSNEAAELLLVALQEINKPTPLPAGRCECGQPKGH